MLKLKVERKLSYLSPSSLMASESQPHKFYMERLIDDRIPRDPQGKAAAVGSAFDAEVKKRLLSNGIAAHKKDWVLEEVAKSIELEDFKEEATNIGKKIVAAYSMEVMNKTLFYDIEIHKQWTFDPYKNGGVPLFVKLDASYHDNNICNNIREVPFDWKCSGLNPDNTSTVSPNPKYFIQYKGRNVFKYAHKDYYDGIPMHIINPKWATQLCTYGWALGLSPKLADSFPARIDMITKNKAGEYIFSLYEGLITPEFQVEVYNRYENLWKSICNGTFVDRLDAQYDINAVFTLSTGESWY